MIRISKLNKRIMVHYFCHFILLWRGIKGKEIETMDQDPQSNQGRRIGNQQAWHLGTEFAMKKSRLWRSLRKWGWVYYPSWPHRDSHHRVSCAHSIRREIECRDSTRTNINQQFPQSCRFCLSWTELACYTNALLSVLQCDQPRLFHVRKGVDYCELWPSLIAYLSQDLGKVQHSGTGISTRAGLAAKLILESDL